MPRSKSITPPPVRYEFVPGFPGYRVGDDGSVWSRRVRGYKDRLGDRWRRLKPWPHRSGHLLVMLARDGEKNYRCVHRLVLEAFVGPRPEEMQCRHLNGRPSDNRLRNVTWGTQEENCADSVRHGTAYFVTGEGNPNARLTPDLVERIMAVRRESGAGARAICRAVGLPVRMRGAVGWVISGRNWNHITGLPSTRAR